MPTKAKPLIATIVFNSNQITNECFLKSLYKYTDEDQFDLLIVSTSDNKFFLADEHKCHRNIKIADFKELYGVTVHGAAIQKILDVFKNQYDDIIVCENDTIIKQDLLNLVDHDFQFAGKDSGRLAKHKWWTRLYEKMHFGCRRYLPMLMYFNIRSFKDRQIIFEKHDCNLQVDIPTLNIHLDMKNTWLCDPGWYFMLWCESTGIKCKEVDIDEYISHFWYGSENRNSKSGKTYQERLSNFKQENLEYL